MNEKIEIKLQPGICELTDLNTAIEQKLQYYSRANGEFKINGLKPKALCVLTLKQIQYQ